MTATAIVGAQYGSEGKGVLAARIASRFDVAVRTGGPNAGHTFAFDGKIYKMRQLPCGWINPACDLVLGAGAVIDPKVLADEIKMTGRWPFIDRHAVVIGPGSGSAEKGLVERIGSTGEGVGVARAQKVWREEGILAKDTYAHNSNVIDTMPYLWMRLERGKQVLLEGTQGYGLSLHHGEYPYVTSEDTNVAQLLANAGIAPDWLVHTLLVARTYPIRVGGPSGPLKGELEWGQIPGAPKPERTTVTNRERRIGEWDWNLFTKAVMVNEPCGVVLNFADYLDPHIREKDGPHQWTDRLREIIYGIEMETPVVLVGVGGEQFSMVQYHRCAHGDLW